jgi:hypothetical protein
VNSEQGGKFGLGEAQTLAYFAQLHQIQVGTVPLTVQIGRRMVFFVTGSVRGRAFFNVHFHPLENHFTLNDLIAQLHK